ncbi:MAG TPA: outer membrane beta-barrel protein [Flavisolibacter sp.]|nr:outer membrane beta-barrel protein [Flavisolibacter sp.]
MKSIIAAASFLLFIFSSFSSNAQVTIFAGPQMTSAQYGIRGANQETSYKTGFMGGVGLKAFLEGPVYFSPMLFFSRKGYDVTFDRPNFPPDSGAVNNSVVVNTIELAPLLQINFSNKESYGFVRFGPSFDFNLSGRETFDSTSGRRISRDMKFSFGDYSYATVSMNVQTGFQHRSGFTAFVFINAALSSLNNADYGPKIFHRVGGVALGWTLGKKK